MREDYYAINPGPPIQEDIIADVVHYVAKDDGRIQASELTLDKWARAVTGIGADLLKDIVSAYYAKHDPKEPDHKPIQPGWIRAEARSRMDRAQNLKRLEAPPEERRGGPPEHIAQQFAAFKAKYPRLLNK